MEVVHNNKVDIVTLAKMVTTVGREYAALKEEKVTNQDKIDFGKIIKYVCAAHQFDDLFGHLPYETAIGQYFGKARKQKAELDIVLLPNKKVRIRVGVCTFADYTIIESWQRQQGKLTKVLSVRHSGNIRPKNVRYDDFLMSSKVVERHANAWLEKRNKKP